MADSDNDNGKSPDPDVKPTAGSVDTDNQDSKKFVLGKHEFKSPEEAGKSYEEAVSALNQAKQEIHEAKQQREQLEQRAKLAEKLDQIAKNTAPDNGPTSFETFAEGLKKKYGDDDAQPHIDALQVVNDWISQREHATEARLKEIEEIHRKEIANLASAQGKLRPDYLANKEMVDKLTAGGMRFDDAINMAKDLSGIVAANQPDRIMPPSSLDNSRVTPKDNAAPKPWFTEGDRAEMKAEGISDEQIDEWEAQHQKRVQQGAEGGAS